MLTTIAVIIGSVIPDANEPNKALAVGKIIGLSAVVLGGGVALFLARRRRADRAAV
jgi:hypothetical protein